MMTCEKIVCHQPAPGGTRHNVVLGDDGQPIGQLGDPKLSYEAGDELVRLTKAYQAEHGVTYQRAHDIVLGLPENATTVQVYAGIPRDPGPELPTPIMSSHDASLEIDGRVRGYQEKHPDTSYEKATKAVLDADPELKAAYAFGAGGED